jgi:hypothetical protein
MTTEQKSMVDEFLDHFISTCSTPERTEKVVDKILVPLLSNLAIRFYMVRLMFHGLTILLCIQTVLLIIILVLLIKLSSH